MPTIYLMERHDQLMDVWRQLNLRDAHVVHLDFHCDMRGLLVDAQASRAYRITVRSPDLDEGNFITHAIFEGRVSRLRWKPGGRLPSQTSNWRVPATASFSSVNPAIAQMRLCYSQTLRVDTLVMGQWRSCEKKSKLKICLVFHARSASMSSIRTSDHSEPRLPPLNLEAEQCVLGAILLNNDAMSKAMEILTEEDFYRSAHQKIYTAMLDLSNHGEVIDQITLFEHLKMKEDLESVGGAAYLAELVQVVPTAANIKYHCRIVRDKALLRGLIETSTDVIARGYEGTAPVDDLLDFAERSVFSLAQGKLGRSFIRLKDVIKESLDYVDVLSKRPQVQERLTTEIADTLEQALEPRGVFVLIEAEHLCMTMRGVKKPGSVTATSAVRGVFRTDARTRTEALELVRRGGA
jgi:hypothetical protein